MKSNYIIVYVPFLIILLGLAWPIKQKPYNISIPQSLSGIENLNIEGIKTQKQINIEPKEVFLINKNDLFQNATQEFDMPQLTIISKDKSGYFCFLDGRFYRSGDSSKDFKVLKIGSDYVILQTPIGRQTLYVKIP
ncbi:hypothetical protein DESAMIL20_1667 [Desulfurella amilsii]|uniref:Type II secretion system protein GspC N-terminal domain-containing protein n=1 Tax=Desulfurella amilsii TaxID=1562698 RepID=A0A1X4XX70_9BACT|nr:hypothetical protein [Desulfurella amilsii]OSS42114.1 hypothetical protein DESAMIL20_1667 [Desulfurella amilsii]